MSTVRKNKSLRILSVGSFCLGTMIVCFFSAKLMFAAQPPIFLEQTASSEQAALQSESPQRSQDSHLNEEQRLIDLLLNDDLDTADVRFRDNEKWRVVRMRVTGYCPCPSCCGSYSDGITACNHRIHPGDAFVAADQSYPFGTKMIIPGYHKSQTVEVLDRGGAIKGDRLDIFFHTHEQALEWGVQVLDVLVKVD